MKDTQIPPHCKLSLTSGYVYCQYVAKMDGGKIVKWNDYIGLTDDQRRRIEEFVAEEVKKGNCNVR